MGMFIKIEFNPADVATVDYTPCVDVCPVDIFRQEGERIVVVEEKEDECTLCGLCTNTCPPGSIAIRKLYEE